MASITEYPLPMASPIGNGNSLFGITAGPDGNVYFTDTANNAIGKITPSGVITEKVLSSSTGLFGLRDITLGQDQRLYFSESTQGAIGKYTTAGVQSRYPIDSTHANTDQKPSEITTASDGSIWWIEIGTNSIGRLTTDEVIHHYQPPDASNNGFNTSSLTAITAGINGDVWFVNNGAILGSSYLGKISSTGTLTTYPTSSILRPNGIVYGPDGNLWITDALNTISVVSTSGTLLHTYQVPVPQGVGGVVGLSDITVGSDKNLYFTESIGNIGQITTDGTITITPVSTTTSTVPGASGPQPYKITSGPDGNIWFTDPYTNSIGVLKIDNPVRPDPGPSDPGPPDPVRPDPGPSDPGPPDPVRPDPGPSDPGRPAPTQAAPSPIPRGRLPRGFKTTTPRVLSIKKTRQKRAVKSVVIRLDQGIKPQPKLTSSDFQLTSAGPDQVFGTADDLPLSVGKVQYNAQKHTITLTLRPKVVLQGNTSVTVQPHRIVNLVGQSVDGFLGTI